MSYENLMQDGGRYTYIIKSCVIQRIFEAINLGLIARPMSVELLTNPYFDSGLIYIGDRIGFQMIFELESINVVDSKEECLKFLTRASSKKYEFDQELVVLYGQNGKIVAGPWQYMNYCGFSPEFSDDYDIDKNYWSSLQDNIKLGLESRVLPWFMRTNNKTSLDQKTSQIVYRLELSDYSYNKMKEYNFVEYMMTDGDNQIWISDDNKFVFKLISDRILFEHEIFIYKKNLGYLPKMIEYWSHENENFICFEKKGTSLLKKYFVEGLLPDSIREQRDKIIKGLLEAGIKFVDTHLGNFVEDNGLVFAIDAESMMMVSDYELVHKYAPIEDENRLVMPVQWLRRFDQNKPDKLIEIKRVVRDQSTSGEVVEFLDYLVEVECFG